MVLNYLHKEGTNPSLNIRYSELPIQKSTELGVDESYDSESWGHASNTLMNSLDFSEIMFYGKTSNHNRVIHFTTTDSGLISYFKTGTGSATDIVRNSTLKEEHSAFLPQQTFSKFGSEGNLAMTEFPFYKGGYYHWGIRGRGSRWEVDDKDNYKDTFHQIWVR